MSFKNRDFALGPNDSLWGDDTPLPGTNMQLLATVEQTEGRFSVVRYELEVPEVFPHVHEGEDETIYMLDGEVTITVGENSYDLVPGSFIFMPMGVPHGIKSHTPTWKGLSFSAPGGPFQNCMDELIEFQKAGNQLTPEALERIQNKHNVYNVSPEGTWYTGVQE
jgi:quercetin dioxygenase-like cupin family protein